MATRDYRSCRVRARSICVVLSDSSPTTQGMAPFGGRDGSTEATSRLGAGHPISGTVPLLAGNGCRGRRTSLADRKAIASAQTCAPAQQTA